VHKTLHKITLRAEDNIQYLGAFFKKGSAYERGQSFYELAF
jgi:hypothetical protein